MPNGDFQTWVSGLQHMQTWATGLHHAQTWVTGLQNASVGVCERLRFRCAHAVCGLSSVRCPRRADRACTKRVGSTHLGQGASWALPRRPHFSEGSEKFFFDSHHLGLDPVYRTDSAPSVDNNFRSILWRQ